MTHVDQARSVLRFGLCCQFSQQPISFYTCTAAGLARLSRGEQLRKLANLCKGNAESLIKAMEYCRQVGIGCFRVGSSILPVKTHPNVGYSIQDLPDSETIVETFISAGRKARESNIRLVFHPDQYVVLNSPREDVVVQSIAELEYQAEVADWIGADVINIHAGGAYGDKEAALERFERVVGRLSENVRSRLTVENDDKIYSPNDLFPICRMTGVPMIYDVHHHRCHGDELSIESATTAAIATWNREPLFHLSSPRDGWNGRDPRRHHDLIDPADFPECWRSLGLPITVEVEAKAKEVAVVKLMDELGSAEPNIRKSLAHRVSAN